jgi:ABC-type nickel/cobalt efflux system permease component RcnA
LIYAHLVDFFFYGVIATLVMGLGTGLSVTGIALGTQFARNWFEGMIAENTNGHSYAKDNILLYVRIVGGLMLVFFGWSLYTAAIQANVNHPLM